MMCISAKTYRTAVPIIYIFTSGTFIDYRSVCRRHITGANLRFTAKPRRRRRYLYHLPTFYTAKMSRPAPDGVQKHRFCPFERRPGGCMTSKCGCWALTHRRGGALLEARIGNRDSGREGASLFRTRNISSLICVIEFLAIEER